MARDNQWSVSRRAFCASPLLLALDAKAAEPGLAADIARYTQFGIHRAGSVGEKRTADWLKSRLTSLGYQTRVEPFPIRTLLEPAAQISLNGRKIPAFPQFFPPESALKRLVRGPLMPLAYDHAEPSIRVAAQPAPLLPNWVKPLEALVEEAVRKQASALILSINDPSDDLFVCNQHHREPLPIPVLLVARRDLAAVAAAAKTGQSAQLQIKGKMADTSALNVIGVRPGRGKTIVISTPLTGWFTCGAERGPGIALWLQLAAQLARQDRPVLMLGTGAHEIGQRGMEHALAQSAAPKPSEVALWLHLGASLAAIKLDAKYGYKTQQFLVGTEISKDWAQQALSTTMPVFVIGNATTLGEAGQIVGAGHSRFVGLSGQFPTFHTPLDQGQAVDLLRLDEVGKAAAALVARVGAIPDALT